SSTHTFATRPQCSAMSCRRPAPRSTDPERSTPSAKVSRFVGVRLLSSYVRVGAERLQLADSASWNDRYRAPRQLPSPTLSGRSPVPEADIELRISDAPTIVC